MLYTLTGTTNLSYKEVDTSENLVEAIRQPARFLIAITSPGDWYTNSMSLLNRTLWLPNTKTIFDPCPVGWRVPGNQPWTGLLQGGYFIHMDWFIQMLAIFRVQGIVDHKLVELIV